MAAYMERFSLSLQNTVTNSYLAFVNFFVSSSFFLLKNTFSLLKIFVCNQ